MTDKQKAAYFETQVGALSEEIVQLKLKNEALILELRALKEATAMQMQVLQDEIDRSTELLKQDASSSKAWLEKDMNLLQNQHFVNVNKVATLTRRLAQEETTNNQLRAEIERLINQAKVDAVADQSAVQESRQLSDTIKMW
mmetsp:Transcript_40637/g.61934  ORF Transcript_40637/g.61934 Transcript_40637/m.61934 type:complete len:142 (+) Transcript_40637:2438-2863(+)